MAVLGADGEIATMPYTTGAFSFQVDFGFDASGKLIAVDLKLLSGGTNGVLLVALKEKYGVPDEVSGITTIWRTRTDEIIFSAVTNDDSDALLWYRSRANVNTRGL